MKEIHDRKLLHSYLQSHQLEPTFNEPIIPHLALYSFDQGELICSQGEPSDQLYVLVKGKLKIYNQSAEGRRLVVSFKTPLEVIGDIEYIQGIDIINTVEAVSPVYMIGVHYRWLRQYSSDYAPLLNFLLDIITRKFLIKSNSFSLNLMHPVEVRLASYILSVTYDETNILFRGQLSTSSLTDVSNLIGTSYRHLNRVIQKLCAEGLIERTKEFILVKNKEGLSALANHHIYK
ncbi:Crp/Fnr family transcriptional regulator [Paenibacillus segetis]|uniref:Catabolite gene activator protein n=1 Tax=Paenibacillus segetis TaxID=1325360 RepID=A0ABQ1YEC5_9BACL|nr:cyclic nucleotide-binding domain-containing protein [Paenibacillus segetis]GGH21631.1 catabolite gene activator protein [Paenibacillus segetis]